MPEAATYTTGKPDDAGGPARGSIYTLKSGAGGSPSYKSKGSPTAREAQYEGKHRHGTGSRPKALMSV